MSILGIDINELPDDAYWNIMDKEAREVDKQTLYQSPRIAYRHINTATAWLKDHWFDPSHWQPKDPQYKVYDACSYTEVLEYGHYSEPQAKSYANGVIYYDRSFVQEAKKINMPICKVTLCPATITEVYRPDTYEVMWSNQADLVLKEVEEFPPCLGYWENDRFIWYLSVRHVYIMNSPNLDPRIANLPYVTIFEKERWELL